LTILSLVAEAFSFELNLVCLTSRPFLLNSLEFFSGPCITLNPPVSFAGMTRAVQKRPQHPPTIAASPEMGSRIPASRIFRNRVARRIYRSRITTCRIAAADPSPDGGTQLRLGKRSFRQCNLKK
jgi:hypothetical protein